MPLEGAKDVQVNVSSNSSTAVIRGVRVTVGRDNSVVVYTNSEVEKKPAADVVTQKGTFVSEDGSTLILNGVMIEAAGNGGVVVHTDGSLKVRSARLANSSIPKSLPIIGSETADGKFFTGISSQTGEPVYVEPADEMEDGSIFVGISPETQRPLYTTKADAPMTYTDEQAQKYAKNLKAHGSQDWRVPTKHELKLIFNHRAEIGGFDLSGDISSGWYRSAPRRPNIMQVFKDSSFSIRFSDGTESEYLNIKPANLRCVRG